MGHLLQVLSPQRSRLFSTPIKRKKICYDGGGGMGLGSLDGLSRRRELVELLDSDSVFGYLMQNGVLEPEHVDDIKKEASPAKVNLALLRHVEGGRVAGAQQLLVNALRQSGQLQLANLLDDSHRITALSASGYLGKTRRKGQIQLQVKVKALRLPKDSLPISLNPPATPAKPPAPPREWVSLDDIQLRILALTSVPSRVSVISNSSSSKGNKDVITEPKKKKKKFCLCSCFSGMLGRKEQKKEFKHNDSFNNSNSTTVYYNNSQNTFKTVVSTSAPAINKLSTTATTTTQPMNGNTVNPGHSLPQIPQAPQTPETPTETELEQLQTMACTMQQKASEFNELVQNASSKTHLALLKYFEQDRGTLVLESRTTTAPEEDPDQPLCVVTICMKAKDVSAVRRDVSSGQLVTDVEELLDLEELFERTGASGVKLEIGVDMEELDIAEAELSPSA